MGSFLAEGEPDAEAIQQTAAMAKLKIGSDVDMEEEVIFQTKDRPPEIVNMYNIDFTVGNTMKSRLQQEFLDAALLQGL